MLAAVFGAALLYGDGMITPAISVLSAVEGLQNAIHLPHSSIIWITVTIIVILFSFQRFGTHKVGVVFGQEVELALCSLLEALSNEFATSNGDLRLILVVSRAMWIG